MFRIKLNGATSLHVQIEREELILSNAGRDASVTEHVIASLAKFCTHLHRLGFSGLRP